MSYIPLVVFLLAVVWIVWRGYQARRAYLKQSRENPMNAEHLMDLFQPKSAISQK